MQQRLIYPRNYGCCLFLISLLSGFASSVNAVEMSFDTIPGTPSEAGLTSQIHRGTAEIDSARDFSLPFTGVFSVTAEYFSQESPNEPDTDGYISGYLKLQKSGQLTDSIQYMVTPKAYFHSEDRVDSKLEFVEDSRQRPIATLEEAYITWRSGDYELQVGKQIKTWGVGDAFKPNDAINPHDYLSVPDSFKIGVPAISAYKHGDLFNVNLVLIPFFTPSRLPEMDSRWTRDTTQARIDYFKNLGVFPTFVDDGRDLPSKSLDNMQYGLNLSSSKLIEGWDLGLYYYHGFRANGAIRARIAPPPIIGIEIVYPEFSQYGASFSTTWRQFEFHGEFSYQNTKDNQTGDDYWNYIAGFNYTVDESMPLGIDSIIFVLEYAGESVTKEKPINSFAETSFNRPFPNTVFTKVKIKLSEETQIECGGALNIDTDDYAVGASLKHTFWDSLSLEIGVTTFEGDHSTFYGGWDENDQVYTMLTYYF